VPLVMPSTESVIYTLTFSELSRVGANG